MAQDHSRIAQALNLLGRAVLNGGNSGAAVAGVASHLYFMHGYHDRSSPQILLFYTLVEALLGGLLFHSHGIHGLLTAFLISLSYFGALFLSISVYRLFFHHLRRFPGPLIAKLSKTAYAPYLNRNGKMEWEHAKLHEKYGDFVRIAPNELSIRSVDATTKVNRPGSKFTKENTFYEAIEFNGERNVDSITDREEHRWRRQVWDKALGTAKSLNSYELKIRGVIHEWLAKADELQGQPINTTLFCSLVTLDITGLIGFSKRMNAVQDGKKAYMLHLIDQLFGGVARLGHLHWPIFLMVALGLKGDAAKYENVVCQMTEEREKHAGDDSDVMKHFLQDYQAENPKAFLNRNILYAETQGVITAATDTTSGALSFAMAYLARMPEIQKKLREEVQPFFGKTISGEFAAQDLDDTRAPYLNACIMETLRLHNPTGSAGQRKTPPEGAEIDGVFVPGGTIVLIPHHAIYRDERFFKRANEFIPERWTTQTHLVIDDRGFTPFLQGTYSCPGRRLALMVARMMLAYTVQTFEFGLALGEEGTRVYSESYNNMLIKAGPLQCVFKRRVEQGN